MMEKSVTVCDGCGSIIEHSYEHFTIPVTRLLAELKTERGESYYRVAFASEHFTNAAGEGDNNYVVVDLCQRCVTYRLIPALEKIAANQFKQ